MPDHTMPAATRERLLKEQAEAFLRSDALAEVFDLLNTDRDRIGRDYNGRMGSGGRVLETQVIEPMEALEPFREKLYPLLDELGFLRINKPLAERHSRVLVLAGALNACFANAIAAAEWKDPSTVSVDGLSCYRPVNPKERASSTFTSPSDTEFGVTADAFSHVFGLAEGGFRDVFTSDRNLNGISCIREFATRSDSCLYRVFAAPSSEPGLRRADTADSLEFYVENADVSPGESLLAVTSNRYCNRQFLQLAHYVVKNDLPVNLDVVGCFPDERVTSVEKYDPFQYLQDLIGILDWIGRF
ncbi:MAG TPA: hypothetical protein DCP91_00155 [Eggerthellaceae bacterium]|nr:hypothetical protein [Eggerthellaceae bacterium]